MTNVSNTNTFVFCYKNLYSWVHTNEMSKRTLIIIMHTLLPSAVLRSNFNHLNDLTLLQLKMIFKRALKWFRLMDYHHGA